jgi:UDP-N-acetylglucosamine/UDP-N-acetylgalactosamine diphosphorylase
MNHLFECSEKVKQLISKGVTIPNPFSIDIGEEVNTDQISGNGVKIYTGCRIYGKKTVISAGAQLGYEGSVTIDDCQLGPNVELKGGYFKKSVFLEKANMGLGAQVREGCILEEEASGAHCVGLKQTILFPFVTLGSLINFCDCFMAGGTSRKNHSEVGSSYIHFNFTPDGDKTTASLFGDVARGVMLNQPPIFLGGQGGAVGPLRIGYGNVVAAGTIIRKDILKDNVMVFGKFPRKNTEIAFVPNSYTALSRIIENNIIYLANLKALEQWYIHVRRPYFIGEKYGELLFSGVINNLLSAKSERINRLKVMSEKMPESLKRTAKDERLTSGKKEFYENISLLSEIVDEEFEDNEIEEYRERFLESFSIHKKNTKADYIETVQAMHSNISKQGIIWLNKIIDKLCSQMAGVLPSLDLFKNRQFTGR